METELNVLKINGIEYVPKTTELAVSAIKSTDGLKYVIVRTHSAGVFAGYLKSRTGQEVVLLKARRLWYWAGAASLSQLAVDGTSEPKDCKFPCEVGMVELLQAIEILDVTPKAFESIKSVKVWQA